MAGTVFAWTRTWHRFGGAEDLGSRFVTALVTLSDEQDLFGLHDDAATQAHLDALPCPELVVKRGAARIEAGQQPLGIGDDVGMQIARMGVERRQLAGDRLDHAAVAMAQRGDVVIGIEVGGAIAIVEPHALPSDKMQRLFVKQPIGRA